MQDRENENRWLASILLHLESPSDRALHAVLVASSDAKWRRRRSRGVRSPMTPRRCPSWPRQEVGRRDERDALGPANDYSNRHPQFSR